MTVNYDGYCLKTPHGRIVSCTFGYDKQDCWARAFEFIATVEGAEWRRRYWKRWDASKRAAKKRGWKIVPVEIIEREARSKEDA